MSDFKVGDKVRVLTDDFGTVDNGAITEILEIENDYDFYVRGKAGGKFPLRLGEFELVNPLFDFKPGDVVRQKNNPNALERVIVGYHDSLSKAFPEKYTTYWTDVPAVIYEYDQYNGYHAWDRAADMVLVRRPEVEQPRKDWTDLDERAQDIENALVMLGWGDVAAVITELRSALTEESYR